MEDRSAAMSTLEEFLRRGAISARGHELVARRIARGSAPRPREQAGRGTQERRGKKEGKKM